MISQLEGELGEVQSHYEAQLVSKDQQLTQKDQQLQQLIKASSQRHTQKQGLEVILVAIMILICIYCT